MHVTHRGFFRSLRFLFRSSPQVTARFVKAMLPRNLLSTAARSAARRRLQVVPSSISRIHPIGNRRANNALSIGAGAQFHSSARRHNELPKSPFQTFVDVLKDELRKNREFAENVKQLQGDVDKFQDSEAMKKAKEAYERARVCLQRRLHCV
jgi:import inner membrane translocase subunit TIM44